MSKIQNVKYRAKRLTIEGLKYLYDRAIYQGLHKVPKLPPFIVLEVTNYCNLKCIMCDYIAMTRKKTHMDMALFKKVIDEMERLGLKRVGLSRFGEPLLHPRIIEMIKYAKSHGIRRVTIASNATRLTEDLARELVTSGLDDISFSIDGSTRKTFEKIRVGAKYDKVVKNIERFIKIRKELGSATPVVRVNAVLMEENKDEYIAILEKWRPIVDGVRVSLMAPYGDVTAHSTVEGLDDLDSDVRGGKTAGGDDRRPCPQLWNRLVILSNGETTVCCADYEGKLSVGNARDSSIEKLWSNEKIRKIRDANFHLALDEIPMCKNCVGTTKTWVKTIKKTLLKYDGAISGDVDI